MGKNNCYWYPSEFYANWNIRNILCACHKYNETELNGKLAETTYSIDQNGSSLSIRTQQITKKANQVNIIASFITSGQGQANILYNGGTIPQEACPNTDMVFIVPVTKNTWNMIGIGTIIIRTNGIIQYQINTSFQAEAYLWLNACYEK